QVTSVNASFMLNSSSNQLALQPNNSSDKLNLTCNVTSSSTINIPCSLTTDTFALLGLNQTLTNKTITDSTNNVSANNLKTTGSDVIINGSHPPTVGQALIATSATAAIWQNLAGYLPLTTKGDILVNNGSTNIRLPVGSNGTFLVANSTQADGIYWSDTITNPLTISSTTNQIILGLGTTTTLNAPAPSSNIIVSFPTSTSTLATLGLTQTFTGTNTFPQAINNTSVNNQINFQPNVTRP